LGIGGDGRGGLELYRGVGVSGEAGSWLRSWSSSGKLRGEVRDDPDRRSHLSVGWRNEKRKKRGGRRCAGEAGLLLGWLAPGWPS
jgi:hypothetical protein